jgi:hypothetical protein
MKTEEDEAFDELAKRQGGGFPAKRKMAAHKLEGDVGAFEKWWYYEGSAPPQQGEDHEEHTKRMCQIAWSNGAYVAAQPAQEPVGWQTMEAKYPSLEKLDIRMGDGSILCDVWHQSDGDLWWEGSGTGEKFIDPKYANVTHWRVHSDTTPPQREWVGLTEEEMCMIGRVQAN